VIFVPLRDMLDRMTPAIAMPPPGFDDLSAEDKLDYIQALWDRFTARPEDVPVPDWHHEVVAERLDSLDRGEGSGRPWEAVRADLLARLRAVRR
jgi:putative addiction module component (TIGR02574 family)